MTNALLGGLAPREFLRRHWQKRPLLVRAAFPRAGALAGERELAALAARDDIESRVVERRGPKWETTHGPFRKLRYPKRNFTLLVSGLNLHLRDADALLRRFSFVPQARLDDVMVSFATPGGGVGPHVDSYDVFLVQGPGRRRWRVWRPGGALDRDDVLDEGDLLYLPPGWKHDGTALDRCFTYSVGFRAPRGAELAAAFLDYLHERGLPDARYRDPGLAPVRRAAALPVSLVDFTEATLARVRWSRSDVGRFLGEYLTMPKAHVVFRPGRRRRRPARGVVRLDPATQLLYDARRFFMNGETVTVAARHAAALRELADRRSLPAVRLASPRLAGLVSAWQRLGYLHFESA